MSGLPSGNVTFLFTDVEASTRLFQQHPEAMKIALARHNELLQQAVAQHGGHVFQVQGDGFCVAFAHASDALNAALAAQRAPAPLDPAAARAEFARMMDGAMGAGTVAS